MLFDPFGDIWNLFEIGKHDDNPFIRWIHHGFPEGFSGSFGHG
jgi:hypothetical protein